MTTTLVVLADPNAGDEALGRVFNALAAAHDFKAQQQPVRIVFQGAGTRWLAALNEPAHPAHALFRAVEDTVLGASAACATVFGAAEDVSRVGAPLLSDNPIPGTAGLASIARFAADGPVLTF